MRYETYIKNGVIEHPDKGDLEIVNIDKYVDIPTIPELTRYAGSIMQTISSNSQNVTLVSESDWITTEIEPINNISSPFSYSMILRYTKNESGDYRRGNVKVDIGLDEVCMLEIVQKP